MATLQVKHLPDALHAELRRRAAAENLTLSDYVTRLIGRDLRRPALNPWLDALTARPMREPVEVVQLLDEIRDAG